MKISRHVFFALAVALIIRIINPTFGTTALYVIPDEVPNYLAAFEMLAKKTVTTSSQYPPLGSYILIPFNILAFLFLKLTNQIADIGQFELFLLTHEGYFLFIPRIISAIFGAASLIVVYKLTQLLIPKNRAVAVWSLLLTAFSATHLQLSHIGKPWISSQFFYLLALYWIFKYFVESEKSSKYLLFAAGTFAISLGFHFSAIYGFLLVIILFIIFKKSNTNFIRSLFLVGIIPLISFLIFKKILMTYPYQASEFMNILSINLRAGLHKGVWFYISEFILTEPVLFIFLGVSFFYIKYWPKFFKPIMIYSLVYFLIMALTFYQSLRYLLPIIPLLSIPAAFAIERFRLTLIPKVLRNGVGLVLTLLILFPSFLWLIRWVEVPTFIDAQHWLNQHMPNNVAIASNAVRFSPFVPNKEAIQLMQEVRPGAWGRLENLNIGNLYPETVRNIIYLDVATTEVSNPQLVKEFMKAYHISYLIQSYWDPKNRFIHTHPKDWKLIQHFSPRNNSDITPLMNLIHGSANAVELMRVKKFGPYIDILEIIEEQ